MFGAVAVAGTFILPIRTAGGFPPFADLEEVSESVEEWCGGICLVAILGRVRERCARFRRVQLKDQAMLILTCCN